MDRQYGILREQGEFMDPVQLTEEENERVNRSSEKKSEDNNNSNK